MNLLIVYNFDVLEKNIDCPNFYQSCADKVFPKFSLNVSFLPNFQNLLLYKFLTVINFNTDKAWDICVFFWLAKNGHKYDIILGWLTGGIMAGILKILLKWKSTKVCLILYKVSKPNPKELIKLIKYFILRISSKGSDMVLALDTEQAKSFANSLGRNRENTKTQKYGIDTSWYDKKIKKMPIKVIPRTIFCPGSANRNDDLLKAAVKDLAVSVKRYQLDQSCETSSYSQNFGKATIQLNYNIPYNKYISECSSSALVVIAVENSDKPVGLTSLLECMALGRPVIISDGASSRDYVIDGVNGLLFKEGNWKELHKKIKYLLNNPDYAERIGAKAAEHVRSELGLHLCGKQLYHHLHNIALDKYK